MQVRGASAGRAPGIINRSRRHAIWACVAVFLCVPAGPGLAQSLDFWPAVFSSSGFTVPVASGILYSHFKVGTAAGPLNVHHLSVDLSNPTVRAGAGLAHNRLMSDDETVSSMVARSGAIAGVNGDFFDIRGSGMPLNIVVRDGQLLRSPTAWVAFAMRKDGRLRIDRFKWTGTVVLSRTGESHALAGYNAGLPSDGLTVISDALGYGAPVPEPGMRQVVAELAPADPPGNLVGPGKAGGAPGAETPGLYTVKQIWPQQAFYAPFPAGEILLVGRGRTAAKWIRDNAPAGTALQVNLTTDPDWHELRAAIGGGPVLVQCGLVVNDPHPPSPRERNVRYPVTALGILKDGHTVILVEVDGRQPRLSIGLTQPQLAAYMNWLGASEAMAFDSGGSATMVVRLPGRPHATVVNSPSDGHERRVADALLFYSSAVPGPAVRLVLNSNQPLRLVTGATAPLSIIGVDAQGNPVVPPQPVRVTAQPQLVTVTAAGVVRVGEIAGTGVLRAESGGISGTVPLSVVARHAEQPPTAPATVGAQLPIQP
ncbi:MAG: phosphodiester glycosidase family protein [Bacillati bacterium ANGP1]|uniref:Phosphodiester glycosidase family protein n=1 Tax=Candidatus Segetimicrobium genomatis TaxID=2569760 RepID=A0A537JZQ9_9BACT|nr:MAG: phosphodiester glycosidase family protein [Terrabacteria group bacterium ANGP1]